jgi:hypothetical protein
MCATHTTKNAVRYHYYVSQPYLRGIATPPPGAITRVPAPDIEATTTSVPGPRQAPIVARAPAVSASRVAFNTNALLKVGATSTGPMFINSAVCRQRHAPLGADNLADLDPLRAKAFAEGARLRAALFTRRLGPAPRHGGSTQHGRRRARTAYPLVDKTRPRGRIQADQTMFAPLIGMPFFVVAVRHYFSSCTVGLQLLR